MSNKKEISLYIHIPFCKQKCFYCDFPSYANLDNLREDYINALCKEIENKAGEYLIKSIFIGGGTPSYLNSIEIEKILLAINKLKLDKNVEFTMECNPGTMDEEKLKTMLRGGVNRISMGLQAVQNHLLKEVGRIHSFNEFKENFMLARKLGFKNINVDLMFGLPNQKVEEWRESLEVISSLEPEHISAYSLIIEEDTAFYKLWENNNLLLPSEDEEREMYEITKSILKKYGYRQYEISNYAKDGYECYHNKVYWKYYNYLGLGSSSTSFIDGKRTKNIVNVKEYIENINLGKDVYEEVSINSLQDSMEEFVFMGLRMLDGISLKEFNKRFGVNIESIYKKIIDKNIDKKLLVLENDKLKLTEKGVEVSNSVMSDFIII